MKDKMETRSKSWGVTTLCKAMAIVFKAAPGGVTVLLVLLYLARGLFAGFNAKVTQYFFDTVAGSIGIPGGFGMMIGAGAVLGGYLLLSWLAGAVENIVDEMFYRRTSGKITELINLKSGRIEPICYDDPKVLDEIEKGSASASPIIDTFRLILSIVFLYGVSFTAMSWYLYHLEPILAITPVVIFIPIAVTQLMRTSTYAHLEDRVAPIRRECRFYQDCMGRKEYFKETRVLNAFGYFRHLLDCALTIHNREYWKAERKRGIVELVSKLMSLSGFVLILWLLIDAVWAGRISVGAFAAVFASINSMVLLMELLIIWQFGYTVQNMGQICNFISFMELPEREGLERSVTLKRGIEAENISFRYPGTDKPALSGVNLTIRAGETLAIVGENGSGKSTLVKMLLGLYQPQTGNITYDGQDISKLSAGSLFAGTSAVFQDFQRYKLTVKDNVAISDLEYAARNGGFDQELTHLLNDTTSDAVSRQADQSLKGMGIDCADIEKYPAGINTLLDREFGGIDLSGGQWQKIAIARGLFRQYHLIALDEPTAAIDPVEETRLYKQFMDMSQGVTSLIVTHRLGSVRIADRIIVMDRGRIVQTGVHDELVCKPGKYREMWQAQAQYYQS